MTTKMIKHHNGKSNSRSVAPLNGFDFTSLLRNDNNVKNLFFKIFKNKLFTLKYHSDTKEELYTSLNILEDNTIQNVYSICID